MKLTLARLASIIVAVEGFTAIAVGGVVSAIKVFAFDGGFSPYQMVEQTVVVGNPGTLVVLVGMIFAVFGSLLAYAQKPIN